MEQVRDILKTLHYNDVDLFLAILDKNNVVTKITRSPSINEDLFGGGDLAHESKFTYDEIQCVMFCNCPESIADNEACIGYTYNEDLNKFVPPKPDNSYILNEDTLEWNPNKNLIYNFYGDEKQFRWKDGYWIRV